MKYVVYATGDNGNGQIQKIGEYEYVEDIRILCGLFAGDTQITINEEE